MRRVSLNDFKKVLYTGAMYTAPRSKNTSTANSELHRINVPVYPELITGLILTNLKFSLKLTNKKL